MNVEIIKEEPVTGIVIDTLVFPDYKRMTKYYARANAKLLKFLQNNQIDTLIEIKTTVTHNSESILSLYRDIRIGTSYVRIGDTWLNGYPISLKGLGLKRKDIIKKCIDGADILHRSGYISLYQNYSKLIQKKYRPECFYIQDGYPVIFFQPGILAVKSQNIICFKCDLLFEIEL